MGTSVDEEILAAGKRVAKRQFRSAQERRRIAEESLQPGASVAVVARSNGVNANQVFLWRKLLRQGRLDANPGPAQLVPVRVAEVIEDQRCGARSYSGAIHLEVGRARIRVEGSVDPDNLRTILEHLGR